MPKKPQFSFSYENPLVEQLGEAFFDDLPTVPGVYFMLDSEREILYIGKAKNLRKRLLSYKNAKPGRAPENIIEMLEHAVEISWEEHKSEAAALARETDLIRAICPPYNIAGADPESYLYIGTRPAKGERVDFRLTSIELDGYKLFGCYKHRRKTKAGYTALLRLIHAATVAKPRFSFPAKITRVSPPYVYSIGLPEELHGDLEKFLAGKSKRLLQELTTRLLDNEHIPAFMYAPIQKDLELVKDFYRIGPHATERLRKQHGIKAKTLSHGRLRELIASELKIRPSTAPGRARP